MAHHLLNSCRIANPIAGNHRVVNMLLEIIYQQIGHGSNTSLCLGCVCLVQRGLAAKSNLVLLRPRHLQRETHTGHTAAYN